MSGRKVWVHAEVEEGRIVEVVFELLAKARELADSLGDGARVECTLVGNNLAAAADLLGEWGAETVYVADDPALAMYSPLTHVPILTKLAAEHQPDIYLFGATSVGASLGPAVAARLKTGMAAHCVDLLIDDEKKLKALVPSFGGKVVGEIFCPERRPQMASVKPGIFERKPVSAKTAPRVERIDPSGCLDGGDGLKPVKTVRQPPHGMPLNEAEVVVCGGLGIGDAEKWRLLEKLAGRLGGAVACTRPAVDEGWSDESAMIGTSGRSVRPKVYLGFGVSGATHHICGMHEAGFIVNVNRDAGASIFNVSDLCVEADAGTIVQAMLEALE